MLFPVGIQAVRPLNCLDTIRKERHMLRIVVCCLGGASSSAMAKHFNDQLVEKGLTERYSIRFMPFSLLAAEGPLSSARTGNLQDEFDVALLCPHQEFEAKRLAPKLTIPVFVIPMRMYGPVAVEHLIEDAEDVLELWRQGVPNVIEFPDEGRSMVAPRAVSHRRWASGER